MSERKHPPQLSLDANEEVKSVTTLPDESTKKQAAEDALLPTRAISLNIGGTVFQTTISTLASVSPWVLSQATTSDWTESRQAPPFYDADPTVFSAILLALRTKTPFQPPALLPMDAIAQQLQFWGLPWFECRDSLIRHKDRDSFAYFIDRFHTFIKEEGKPSAGWVRSGKAHDNALESIILSPHFADDENVEKSQRETWKHVVGGTECTLVEWPGDVYPSKTFTAERHYKDCNTWFCEQSGKEMPIGKAMQEAKCATFEDLLRHPAGQDADVKQTVQEMLIPFQARKEQNRAFQSRFISLHHCLRLPEYQQQLQRVAQGYGFRCDVKVEQRDCHIRRVGSSDWIKFPHWVFGPPYDEYHSGLRASCCDERYRGHDPRPFSRMVISFSFL
jgi:hypothetical protein